MQSRRSLLLVLCALVVTCLVVAWTTKPTALHGGRAYDAVRGRAAISRFFSDVRGGVLPRLETRAMPVPWGIPFGSDDYQRAWESYLATIAPRLRALDELHDDPDVQGLLREGDGAPVLEPAVRLHEWFCLWNELINSAVIALEHGDVDTAMKRVAQAFEFELLDRDHDWLHTLPVCSTWGHEARSFEILRKHPRWEPKRAFDTIAPLVRAVIEDQERYLDRGRALHRRLEGVVLGLQREDTSVGGVLEGIELSDSFLDQSLARKRTLLLALAADAFRAEHGRWPADTSELASRVRDAELLTSLASEPLEVMPDGADLRIGLVRSKRPANEYGTTLTLTR